MKVLLSLCLVSLLLGTYLWAYNPVASCVGYTTDTLPEYYYTIQPKDTFWNIARRLYPDKNPSVIVARIQTLNPHLNPQKLMPKDVVLLP